MYIDGFMDELIDWLIVSMNLASSHCHLQPICAYLIDWLHVMPLTPLADNTVDDGHTDDDDGDDGHIDGDEDDDDDDDDDDNYYSQHSITTTAAVQQLSVSVEDRDDEQR